MDIRWRRIKERIGSELLKNIVIESLVNSQKVAVLEDGKLSELFIESNSSKNVSNIYRGIVKKALKGIEAYFVDILFYLCKVWY